MRKPTDEELMAAGLIALLWLRKRRSSSSSPEALTESSTSYPSTSEGIVMVNARWHWPLPVYVDDKGHHWQPEVSSGMKLRNASRPTHDGVDIMYRRLGMSPGARVPPQVKGDNGSSGYFTPKGTPVLAALDGTIWSIGRDGHGMWIHVDNGSVNGVPTSTIYRHLESTVDPMRKGKTGGRVVRAGELLGIAGFSPKDSQKVRHLHLEVKRGPKGAHVYVDPEALNMAAWARRTWEPSSSTPLAPLDVPAS